LANAIRSTYKAAGQEGFGLLGVIVTMALSTVVVGVVYTVYIHGDRARQVSYEAQNVAAINQAVQASYAGAANYATLTQTNALHDKLFPKAMLDGTGTAKDTWGGDVQLAATTVNGVDGRGFALTYEGVPQATCTRFAAQGAPGFFDTKINNQSIVVDKTVNINAAVALCAAGDSNVVQFLQVKSSPDAGPGNPTLTPCAAPPPATRNVACPAGQLSSVAPYGPNGITQQQDYSCNSPYGDYASGPWNQIGSTCVPACVAPPPSPTSQSLTGACPAGQYVANTTTTSFPQTQAGTINYSCPLPVGSYTPNAPVWGAITPPASSVCAPICTPPAPTATSRGATGSCPAGQVTASGATTFAQTQAGTISYTCNSPTGSAFTAQPPVWGGLTPPAASVCAAKCVAPAPTSVPSYQNVTVNAGCPAGYSGAHTYQKQQVRTTTTTYACPAPQGAYTTASATSGWSDTGATSGDSNTCTAPPPPAPACATTSPANYTLVSYSLIATVTQVGHPGSQVTDCSATPGICHPTGGSTQNNLSMSVSVTVKFNGTNYTVTGNGLYPAGRSASINCTWSSHFSDGCSLSGSLPPGLDFNMSAFGGSQIVANLGPRACP